MKSIMLVLVTGLLTIVASYIPMREQLQQQDELEQRRELLSALYEFDFNLQRVRERRSWRAVLLKAPGETRKNVPSRVLEYASTEEQLRAQLIASIGRLIYVGGPSQLVDAANAVFGDVERGYDSWEDEKSAIDTSMLVFWNTARHVVGGESVPVDLELYTRYNLLLQEKRSIETPQTKTVQPGE